VIKFSHDYNSTDKRLGLVGQYLVYTRTHAATLDTSRAGLVNVQFGIGSASSIGSTIRTPVGDVEFHVVKADTPCLLCLADMDTLKVYYNNLTNTLITHTKLFQWSDDLATRSCFATKAL
jgi:hypothetical protein